MKIFILLLFFSFFLLGCTENTVTVVDSDTFFETTTIESEMFGASASVASTHEMLDDYMVDPLVHIECTNLEDGLNEIDLMSFNTDEILAAFEDQDDNTHYYIVPIYNTWVINSFETTYMYDNNQLTVSITIPPSNFPMTDQKLIVFAIQSDYDYDVIFTIDN